MSKVKVLKPKILKKAKSPKTNLAEKRTKTAQNTIEKQTSKIKQKTKKDTQSGGKVKKPQINQTINPFVDKYLEFYDDIKIPSRRYDW